ncbi:papilin b, proteoglycan-like sulfated glycoprotein [Festucalex cinctus]
MDKLRVLALLLLLAVPAFTQPQDHWGEFGPFGPCSRSCGTGVAMRTRKCITLRTDGGHNCEGSSKSFQICNTNECPVGSRDFREEQCSQFDRIYFQGKRHTWVPYYGAIPCELTCVTQEQNLVYRHRPKVVDGTPCHVGRSDICVDGECMSVSQGVILGLEDVTQPDYSAPTDVNPMTPSLQNPGMDESIMTGFVPHVPEDPSISGVNTDNNPNARVNVPDCARSYYGCCPDGRTSASGPGHAGCAQHDCVNTRYGCCLDGVTAASGFARAGCPDYQARVHSRDPVPPSPQSACSLPRDEGPCDTWKRRFYYNASMGKCKEFWFGSCQGNANNFVSLGECQRACEGVATS